MSNDLFPEDDQAPPLSLKPANDAEVQYIDPNGSPYDTGTGKKSGRVPKWGPTWLAWLLIIGFVGFIAVGVFLVQIQQVQVGAAVGKGSFFQHVFLGKLTVGMEEFGRDFNAPNVEQNRQQLMDSLVGGSVEQRMCKAILESEINGTAAGAAALASTRSQATNAEVEYTKNQDRIESLLESIFESTDAKQPLDISAEDQAFLKDQLPWFGELALLPKHVESKERSELLSRAKTSTTLFFFGILFGLLVIVAGFIMLVIFCVQLARSQFYSRIVDDSRYGPVYAETFALWLALWLAVSFALSARGGGGGMTLPNVLMSMLIPLSALIWPVFRGIPAGEMLLDVGLKPVNPFKEIFYGFLAYLAVIPMLLLSLVATTILGAVQGLLIPTENSDAFAPSGVAHPIIGEAFSGNPVEVMTLVFITACVLAPLTEEIMFRGVLFRHLRDATSRTTRWTSVVVAALISSFVFAAIHPQGLVGIPPLMTLAIAFCLVRQWRGSLVAPMTMHALNNMMPTCIMLPVVI